MENVNQQPCYPRIKRILMGFQDSAKHSLHGPPDTVTDSCMPQQSVSNVDTAESTVVKPEVPSDDTMSSAERSHVAKNGTVAVTSAALESSSHQERTRHPAAGFKRPVLPAPLLMAADRGSKTVELSETRVEGEKISCFNVGGEARLCLPQLLSRVLYNIPPSTLQSVTDALHVYFAECGAGQLEMLKQARVLPDTVPRSGLVTLTDALRICAILLHDHPPCQATPNDMTVIPVLHECFGGCRGLFWPCEYQSSSSLSVECLECHGCLSPEQFISHSHTSGESRTCHWGFDSKKWRSYLMVSGEDTARDDQLPLQKLLDKMKMLFVGKDQEFVQDWLVPAKRARVGAEEGVLFDVGWHWQSPDVHQARKSCVRLLGHTQQSRSSAKLPEYLHTSSPVLENPDRVIPLEDTHRYDRNFAPNVALSVQPFEAVRKQRAAESLAALESDGSPGEDDMVPAAKRRRAAVDPQRAAADASVDDDDDNESVSSDKLEADDDVEIIEPEVSVETQLSTYLKLQMQLFRSVVADRSGRRDEADDLVNRFATLQDRQMKITNAVQASRCVAEQKLREVWSLVEKQQRGALDAQRQHEETVSRLRHEGAARMREAALSRHELLQQVDALTTRNGSSDTALMAAKYKEEADRWKQQLEDCEAVNVRLREELVVVHQAVQQMCSAGVAARALTSLSTNCVQRGTPADYLHVSHEWTPTDDKMNLRR